MPPALMSYDAFVALLGAKVHLPMLGESAGTGQIAHDVSPTGRNFTAQGALSLVGDTAMPEIGSPLVPQFTGNSADFLLSATPTLLGKLNWAISFWVHTDPVVPPTTTYHVYTERGTSGAALNRFYITAAGTSHAFTYVGQNDTAGSYSLTAQSVFAARKFAHVMFVRQGANIRVYVNGALNRTGTVSASAGQAPTSPDARIGVDSSLGQAMNGAIFRLSLWDSIVALQNADGTLGKVTDDAARGLYELGAPIATDHNKPVEGVFFSPKAWCNQRLPATLPIDPAYDAAGIAALQTELLRQRNLGSGFPSLASGTATTRVYTITPSTPGSEYTVQRVRLWGGRYANSRTDKEGLWQALAAVPVPNDAVASGYAVGNRGYGTGADAAADQHMTIVRINADGTQELWEFWKMWKRLGRSSVNVPAATLSAGGTIPAGQYQWGITAYNAHGDSQAYNTVTTTVSGTQKASISITQIPENPVNANPSIAAAGDGIVGYKLWRKKVDAPATNFRVVSTIPYVADPTDFASSKITMIDDGSITPDLATDIASIGTLDSSTTNDWGCGLAGYHPDIRGCVGYFDTPGRTDWGGTATSIPKLAGLVTQREMLAGHIPHGLFAATGSANTSAFVYPAQRTDGLIAGSIIKQGQRYALPRSVDISGYAPGAKAIARAMQEFGIVFADTSGGLTFYIEDYQKSDRDLIHMSLGTGVDPSTIGTAITGGLGTHSLPFDQLVPIDPAWTRSQAESAIATQTIKGR